MVFQTAQDAFIYFGKQLLALEPTVSPRGIATRELVNVHITLKDPLNSITSRTRKTYLFAELLWYLTGTANVEMIGFYADLWNQICDEYGHANSNYGLITGGQLHDITNLLIKDENTRKAVVRIFDEETINSKDTNCTLTQQFLIRDKKLHQIVTMRSNDMLRGFSYDVFWFIITQQIILLSLNHVRDEDNKLTIGDYHHNVGSFHVYESDIEDLIKAIDEKPASQLPPIDVQFIDELYDAEMYEASLRLGRNDFVFEPQSEMWKIGKKFFDKKFNKQ